MTKNPEHFFPSNHHPFRLRKIIVFSSVAIGGIGAYLLGNLLFGLAVYFCSATLLDFLLHDVYGLKASTYSDPKQLLESQRVNGKELDRYFEARKKIRITSTVLACVADGIGSQISHYGLDIFCIVYILATLAGILQVRMSPQIRRPRLIFRDDRYYRQPYLPHPRPFWHMDYLNWYYGRGPLP